MSLLPVLYGVNAELHVPPTLPLT